VRLVEQADPPDICRLLVSEIQAAETKAVLDGPQLRQPVRLRCDRGVAFRARLVRAAGFPQRRRQPLGGMFAQVIKLLIQHRNVLLLDSDLVLRDADGV
jgi:hypothetical protein